MPNAMDGGCGWHLVEQRWKTHGPGIMAVKDVGQNRDKYNIVKKRMKDWCYSWMTPGGVESEDEHHVSKQLLFAWPVKKHLMQSITSNMWLIKYLILSSNMSLYMMKCIFSSRRSSCIFQCKNIMCP
jgi:hypothetical protein